MAWLVGFFLLGFAGLLCLAIGLFGKSNTQGTDDIPSSIGWAGAFLIVVLQLGWALLFSVHFVDNRNVGVVKTFGSITGQVGEGLQLTPPWSKVEEWNIRLQVVEPDTTCVNGTPRCMNAGSIDVQDVYVSAALNMEVDVRDVQSLARNVGPSYIDTIVRNRMEQVTKAIISTYKAEDILSKREEIRERVRAAMKTELEAYSINVTDLLITNIDFTEGFRTEIENKVKAAQQALTEQNKVEISKAQAAQAAAAAQGRADSLRIEAEGQAAANEAIARSLTPQLIQFQAIQKLVDNIQIMLVPDNGTFLNLPSSILTPAR